MSKATEASLRASRLKRQQTIEENENKRASYGGFGKGTTSGSTYLKRTSRSRSQYGSNTYSE